MDVLNGQEVVSAIARNIRAGFTTDEIKEIYKDKPMQGMMTPCIYIQEVDMGHENQMRDSANWIFTIDVRAHAVEERTDKASWARSIQTRLISLINRITVSGQTVKSRSLRCRIEEDVLHVTLTYQFRVREVPIDYPDMEKLYYSETIRNWKG